MALAQDFLRQNKVTAVVTMKSGKPQARLVGTGNKDGESLMSRIRRNHDYHLFKARFTSLFLWPALLSTIAVGEDINQTTQSALIPAADEPPTVAPTKGTTQKKRKTKYVLK